MKSAYAVAASIAAVTQALLLNAADPGKPEDNGLIPVSETFYVNTLDTINNGNTESLGVGIARNGNVLIGWEDDGDNLLDLEAVWTLYGPDGLPLTQDTEITTIDPAFAGQTLTSRFLSYFRSDGSAVSGRTSWGPKIKANLFGDGLGMGATAFDLGIEVVEFKGTQFDGSGNNVGDFPAVQLLSNAGLGSQILSGLPAAYAQRDGDVRIGDWDFLGNGNVVIVGESRQKDDLVNVYGGATPENHAVVRIVSSTGAEVKAVQLVSALPEKSEMWHGVGVAKNGFGVRFADAAGRAVVRLFDNAGTPGSTNIDLATLAGSPVMVAGGRGDSVGFHGNGNNAYAAVARGLNPDTGSQEVWVTVLNADGSLRWAKSVADDVELVSSTNLRCDVGIDAAGRVAVVFNDSVVTGGNASLILGRLFDATGAPLGGTFYVSEKELPDPNTLASTGPRVAFRGDFIAVIWESQTGGSVDNAVVGGRFFGLPAKPGSVESVGLTRIVPDTVVINQDQAALGNWEPYVSVLGTSTFLIEGNAFAEGTTDQQRFVVALQPAEGGSMRLGEAFYSDNGTAYKGAINASRQNGNPGRVAGDPRPGAVNFVAGGEASPHTLDAFKGDTRWNLGYDRLDNGRYGTLQIHRLETSTLTQTPLTKALDSAHGRLSSGAAPDAQISRFGGDLVGLENGNFVSLVEDRSRLFNPDGNAAVATIFAPDGTVVKESFLVANGDQWANLAAVKGGFVVRNGSLLYFYDNAGTLQGSADHNITSGESFATGRGDGTRIAGHINSPYVFLAGKVANVTIVRVAAWDARTREFVTVADVSEGGFRGNFDRATVAADALGRIVVSWVSQPDGYEAQQVAARVLALDGTTKSIAPLTASFLPFINASETGGIRSVGMSLAMTTKQILVAAKGEINLQNQPAQGANSPTEINFYTVISHPNPQEDPTPAVPGQSIAATAVTNGNNLVVAWTGGTAPFKVQVRSRLNTGTWTDVTTTSDRTVNIPITSEPTYVQVVGQ